jgi:hypothetical protein
MRIPDASLKEKAMISTAFALTLSLSMAASATANENDCTVLCWCEKNGPDRCTYNGTPIYNQNEVELQIGEGVCETVYIVYPDGLGSC